MIYSIQHIVYANHPLSRLISHWSKPLLAQTRMWSWPHALEFARELRFFFGGTGGSSSDCSCSLSFLGFTAVVCVAIGFWLGCAISACVLSPKCRRFTTELVHLGLQVFFGHQRPDPPAAQPAQELALRRRLQQYRA